MGTFGDTTLEGTALTTAAGSLVLGQYVSPADAGTGTDIQVGCKSASTTQTCYAVLYADASGVPGALLGSGAISPASGAATFYDASGLSITLAPSTTYWIGFFNPAGNVNKSVQVNASGGTSYQVVAGGATPPSVCPGGGTAGVRKISAYVTYTPSGGGGSSPVNTVAPVVSGSTVQGSVLNSTTGTWTNTPTSYGYQWMQDDGVNPPSPISGAITSAYTLQATDVGVLIYCVVTATNGSGSTPANSNEVGPVTGNGYTLHSSAFTYLSADGVTNWPVDVYVPDSPNGFGLVLVHGGTWDSNDRTVLLTEGAFFAALGFTCFAGDFTQEGPGVDALINRQTMIDDVGLLMAACRSNATYSSALKRVGMLGESSGGHLAYMVACTKTGAQKPDAVVGWSPVTRFDSPTLQALPTPWGAVKGYLDDNAPSTALCQQFSPYNNVTSACCSMRIAGSNTEQIPKEQFDDMFSAATGVGIGNVVEQTYPGSVHSRLTNLDGSATATWLLTAFPASGGLPTLTVTAPGASATAGAAVSAGPGTLTLTSPVGSAFSGSGAGGGLPTLTISAPLGTAHGSSTTVGGLPTLVLGAPQAIAQGGGTGSGPVPGPTGAHTGSGVTKSIERG